MLWRRCEQKEKAPSKAKRRKEKNEGYRKRGNSNRYIREDDYQGELNSLIYQEQLYSEKIKLQEKNSVFFGNTIFSKYDHRKLLLVQIEMTYISL